MPKNLKKKNIGKSEKIPKIDIKTEEKNLQK